MESKFLCIQVFVVLCLLLSNVFSGVLNKNEYEKDELIPFRKLDKILLQSPYGSAQDCCAGCVYIEGVGCIDPNDGSIHPKLKQVPKLKVPKPLECCSGCLYLEGIGCVNPNDGSIRPYHPYVKDSSEQLSHGPKGRCCPRCIYVPGYGCIDPGDPGVHPPFHD